jgi:hypothetical protein
VASRRYRTTRPLDLQVACVLDQLGVGSLASHTTTALITLYVTGLVLLDARPTQTRLARLLPGRCHDALNRLLRVQPWSTRALVGLLIGWIRRLGTPGSAYLDDVVVEKAFASGCGGPGGPTRSPRNARSTACTWWCCCGAARMAVSGSQSRSGGGGPSAAAPRTPTRPSCSWPRGCSPSCSPPPALRLPGRRHPLHRRVAHPPGRPAAHHLGRAAAAAHHRRLARPPPAGGRPGRPPAPGLAPTGWAARRRGHGLCPQVRPAAVGGDQKPSRQLPVPSHQRPDGRPFPGSGPQAKPLERGDYLPRQEAVRRLGACQCFTDAAMVRHVALVLLGFVVLQHLRTDPTESIAGVKERWQLNASWEL